MNILMALSQLELTGAETYAVTLSDELIAKGHKVFIVSDTLNSKTSAEYFSIPFNKRSLVNRVKNVKALLKLIKKNNIQIVHAHSRASGWIAYICSFFTPFVLITTVHGLQPVHFSRKVIKGFGDKIIAVCENISEQLINEFKLSQKDIIVLRNPFRFDTLKETVADNRENIISIIGRLSGPKGDIAYEIINRLDTEELKDYKIKLIGGPNLPEKFKVLKDKFDYLGFIENLSEIMERSKLVFASGRVAVESLMMEIPTIAIGESSLIGLIDKNNLDRAMRSNFGDIEKPQNFKWEILNSEVKRALISENSNSALIDKLKKEFDYLSITNTLVNIYQNLYSSKFHYEIPVLMYHRLIRSKEEIGLQGTYVSAATFEKHLSYLKKNGYKTLTFNDLDTVNRLDKKEKYIILTFDDGYEDNYNLLFPLLKKYNYTAVIYLVSSLDYNKWDVDTDKEKRLKLLNKEMILEMSNYGIEFGSHTETHPDLTKINLHSAEKEIINSKTALQEIIGKEIISFAYPYGAYNQEIKTLVKNAGYKYAVVTDNGPLTLSDDYFEIRRINIFDHTDIFHFARKVKGNYNFKKASSKI